MKRRLLIVEDEPSISEPLQRRLQAEGYDVRVATTMREARQSLAAAPVDLVLLDWTLPDGQGLDLLREWRQAGSTLPVIMLTARAELIDKVLGLELGADDYMTKPFEPRELVARIQARLRVLPGERRPSRLAHHGIELDPDAHTVTYAGRPVELTRMEFALLKLLLENVGKAFSRDELLSKVWGFDAFPTTRTVDTHILQLRQKLAPQLFETVRGVGYRLVAAGSRDAAD